jgi:hypothetical protein
MPYLHCQHAFATHCGSQNTNQYSSNHTPTFLSIIRRALSKKRFSTRVMLHSHSPTLCQPKSSQAKKTSKTSHQLSVCATKTLTVLLQQQPKSATAAHRKHPTHPARPRNVTGSFCILPGCGDHHPIWSAAALSYIAAGPHASSRTN